MLWNWEDYSLDKMFLTEGLNSDFQDAETHIKAQMIVSTCYSNAGAVSVETGVC